MRRYVYRLLGAEISATARFCDRLIQVAPLEHEDGLLLESVDCHDKSVARTIDELELPAEAADRTGLLLNGNFNASSDIQEMLQQVRAKMIQRCWLVEKCVAFMKQSNDADAFHGECLM